MTKLPSGLMPTDSNIEIFADPYNFGKCYFIREGEIQPFEFLPLAVLDDLCSELLADPKAMSSLRQMGFEEGIRMLEQYNYCNRGALDGTADISTSGSKTREYVDCGRRGKCAHEGKICTPISVNGSHITCRELECLRLIGEGLAYKQIKIEMGFRQVTAVNSLIGRLRDKLQCTNNVGIALKAKELGLV
jgi:DNA-binding CsgD family transcriptional regulator